MEYYKRRLTFRVYPSFGAFKVAKDNQKREEKGSGKLQGEGGENEED